MSIKFQLLNTIYFVVALVVLWFILSRFIDSFDAFIVALMLVLLQDFLILTPQIKLAGDQMIGPLVKDCGPNPYWPGYLVGAVFFLMAGLAIIPVYLWGIVEDIVYLFPSVVGCASLSSICLLMAISHLELRSGGIRAYFSVIQWDKIESYTWVGNNDNTLKIKSKYMAWTTTGKIRIPVEFKEAFDDALRAQGVPQEP